MISEQEIKKKLMSYGYYDEQHHYNIVLNESYIKSLFNCDNVSLKEIYNKK